jgi:hypothetical protein
MPVQTPPQTSYSEIYNFYVISTQLITQENVIELDGMFGFYVVGT